jgi:predicted ATPase
MKIRSLRLENHPVLGNLHLEFTNKNGKTVNTVIIAGENGVGKSILLNTIFEFSTLTLDNSKRNEKRIFEIQLSDNEIEILKTNPNFKGSFTPPFIDNILNVTIDFNIINNWDQIKITATSTDRQIKSLVGTLFSQPDTRRVLRMIFSDVEINFTPNTITTVTSKNIDRENIESERSRPDLATEITQLLIDVQSIDALEFTDWGRKNVGQPIEEDKIDVRLKRFTSAFAYMFASKKYKRIENVQNRKQIIFEENGLEMNIDKLSSGEKQIVFRGSFLLKDKESTKGLLVLIDEPEISLHPSWQLQILNYFKMLFTNASGEQSSQIIVATHSPFIIHNANRNDDKVIVLQKDAKGQTVALEQPKFYSWSPEQIAHHAFNVSQVLNNKKLIVFLEGETDETYFTKCLQLYNKTDKNMEFKWIGRINEKGDVENTGDTALNQAKTFFSANPFLIPNKLVLFYDSDTNKPEQNFGNLLIRRMILNESNKLFQIGIENLLNLPADFDASTFYTETEKKDGYGAQSVIRRLDKTKLCTFVCDTMQPDKQKSVLVFVDKEIERLLAQQ